MTAATPPAQPADVPALLRALLSADPGRPRLTWYGPAGERVELSAKVLDNWVAKSANLLVDELDAGPGSGVLVDLPAHWRTLTWLLAVWATGAAVVLPAGPAVPGPPPLPDGLQLDVVLSTDPARWTDPDTGAALVGVALPALATAFGPGLPPGALDAASAVRTHGDVFLPLVRPVPADPALVRPGPDGVLGHGELLAVAGQARSGLPDGVRLLTGAGPDRAVTGWLPALLAGGSLVLHHDLAGLAPADRERLAAQEGVTAVDG